MSADFKPGVDPIQDKDDGRVYVAASVDPRDRQAAVKYFNTLIGSQGGFPLLYAVSMAVNHFNNPRRAERIHQEQQKEPQNVLQAVRNVTGEKKEEKHGRVTE